MDNVYSVNDTPSDQPDNAGEITIVPSLSMSPELRQDCVMEDPEASRVTIKDDNVIQFQGLANVSDVCDEPSSKDDEAPGNETPNESNVDARLASDSSLVEQGIITPPDQSESTTSPSSEGNSQGDSSIPAAEGMTPVNLSNNLLTSKVSNVTSLRMHLSLLNMFLR